MSRKFKDGDIVTFVDPDIYIAGIWEPLYEVRNANLLMGYYRFTGYYFNDNDGDILPFEAIQNGLIRLEERSTKEEVGPCEWAQWDNAKWVGNGGTKFFDNHSYDFVDCETKEFCPKCLSDDICFVTLANRCNACWHTW